MAALPPDIKVRHLARVVESSDDTIVSKDLNGTITSWNRAAERMFGYTAEEMIGRSIRTIIPADRQDEEDMVLARIRAGEVVDHFETVRRRKDGTEVLVSLTVSPIRDESRRVVGASKIARDITERARLKAAADEQAAITSKINEIAAVASTTLDRQAIAKKITDVTAQLVGAEFGACYYVAGGQWEAYVLNAATQPSAGTFTTFDDSRRIAMQRDTPARCVRIDDVTTDAWFNENRPDFGVLGRHAPARSYLEVAIDSVDGAVEGRLCFGHSRGAMFTEPHEQLVSGIARWAKVALGNARLYEEAREANRLKDEFLAVLSHELRTPLNAIVGYARLLRGGILTGAKVQRALETLERNSASLSQIVEDVLDISRIVSGKIRLDIQAVELPIIVHDAVATVRPAADAKAIRIETAIDAHVGSMTGDPNRLQQVVWNLLTNAVKFTPKHGQAQIRVQQVGSEIELVVSDTGVGISPQFLPHVFERFRQGDSATTRTSGGLGLGLAIARNIVEMHGGTIEASSAGPGMGSTFRVRLPIRVVQPQNVESLRSFPQPGHSKPLRITGNLDGVHVLSIDDEVDNGALVREVLEAAGARVTTFTSAREALARIEAVRPDVMVVDLGMPEMDGFDFITRLRGSSDADVRGIPAAALTAFARSEDRTRALESGFEMHLAKPVDPGELVASVAALAKRAKGR